MKRIIAVFALIFMFVFSASAEGVQSVDLGALEIPYENYPLKLACGIEFSAMSGMERMSVPDDLTDAGSVYMGMDNKNETVMTIAITDSDEIDVSGMANQLVGDYNDVFIVNVNSVSMVAFEDKNGRFAGYCMPYADGNMLTMLFSPVPSEDFAQSAAVMMSSVKPVSD